MRFVRTFWLKGNKLPSFVQFTAGPGSPLTVQLNVTLDPICALWFTGALIIVGFRPSIKGNKYDFNTQLIFLRSVSRVFFSNYLLDDKFMRLVINKTMANDFDVGESIFSGFVCPMTHISAQKCY